MRAVVHTLSLTAALLCGAAVPAFASSAVVTLATPGATSLGLDGQGSAFTHIVMVAEVTVSTDAAYGYTLSITSGKLAKVDGSTPVPFRVVLVAHGAAAPSSAAFTTASGSTYTFVTSSALAADQDLYIMYTPSPLQDPGTYTASVDLSVIDN